MKLYHGTSSTYGQQILQEGQINITTDSNTHYDTNSSILNTTRGYVYLTDSLKKAYKFGVSSCTNFNRKNHTIHDLKVYVFEIEVDSSLLSIDKDECRIQREFWNKEIFCNECSIENCLKNTNCIKCNKSLILGKEVNRYKILDSNSGNTIQDWTNI